MDTKPKYQPTIGLEIHAELNTATKMFCDCPNDPGEKRPNSNVCPVCMGHPGCLPTANKKAIESVIRVGLALGGEIAPTTKFDRKNYFYPDLPKGYQISQYDQPLVSGGTLNGIRLRRIHLEEDTGRLAHGGDIAGSASAGTLVDYNRSSVPLMELVTEPDIRSGEEAVAFARELQRILRYLGVSFADMEKGQMRIEANISLNMGTKVEIKNINSFRAVGDAVAYEIVRQSEALEKGEKLTQETRGWDEHKRHTFSQRSKEEAHDYRYFPEPDIPPFSTDIFAIEDLRAELPELPAAKRARFSAEYNLSEKNCEILVDEPLMARFFEEAVSELKERFPDADASAVFNYLSSDIRGILNEKGHTFANLKIQPEHLAHLVALMREGKIMSRQAKDMLRIMVEKGEDPEAILEREGFHTISDESELETAARAIIDANPAAVADYRAGKAAALQFLIGRSMGALKGRGNPESLRVILVRLLS